MKLATVYLDLLPLHVDVIHQLLFERATDVQMFGEFSEIFQGLSPLSWEQVHEILRSDAPQVRTLTHRGVLWADRTHVGFTELGLQYVLTLRCKTCGAIDKECCDH